MRASLLALPLLLVASCDIREPYSPPTIHVSPDGDDANDGLRLPVRTLKRGIGLATANPVIDTILVEAGRYDAASGETFPYTVPENVTISGPAGGGVILAGSGTEPGLVIGTGELRDLELESFTVAITSKGAAQLANLRVRSSGTAVRGEATSKLTVANIDITGTAGSCTTTGIDLNGDADLTASEVSTRALGIALQIKDQTTVSISKANINGTVACDKPSLLVSTTGTLVLNNSIVDGGEDGILFGRTVAPGAATLSGTIVRNMADQAIVGNTVTFTMTGGEISSNGRAGLEVFGGSWTLNNVMLKQNGVMGIYIQGDVGMPGMLRMRGCMVTNNATGIYVFADVVADFGTLANPGANTFLTNSNVGLNIAHCNRSTTHFTAVGNTWRPNVQGSDASGRYPLVAVIPGLLDPGAGGNFRIEERCTLQR